MKHYAHSSPSLWDMAVPQLVLFSSIFNTPTIHLHVRSVQDWGATRLSSSAALLSPSHTVTGSGTSPGSSGTGCWPMSLETDCGPRRADTADMLHTQTACFSAGMISCERRWRSCGSRGRSPFHWHLTRKWSDIWCRLDYSIYSGYNALKCHRLTNSTEGQSHHQTLHDAVIGAKASTRGLSH